MRDVLPDLIRWVDEGQEVALARVVSVHGSAPRRPGTAMIVSSTGEVRGSLSSGCVDPTLYERALSIARSESSSDLLCFGSSDDDVFDVSLSCGGAVDVFVQRVEDRSVWREVLAAVRADRPATVATAMTGARAGKDHLANVAHASGRAEGRIEGDMFLHPFPARPRMFLVGANEFATAASCVGKMLGYRVTVCDPSEVFATPQRFPDADEVVVGWPDNLLSRTTIDGSTVIGQTPDFRRRRLPSFAMAQPGVTG